MLKLENKTPTLIAQCVSEALREELETYPKPGLVSLVDRGSHPDMDAECFLASIEVLEPGFAQMADAGSSGAELSLLQKIGREMETSMLKATNGRNTHRGAIFCLGLLAAAAGRQTREPSFSLGEIVQRSWGPDIPVPSDLPAVSDGLAMCHLYQMGGVRVEARRGFPSVFDVALPVFRTITKTHGREAARVHTFFTLLEICEDTTLLKRGGLDGHCFAQAEARRFLESAGAKNPDWPALAASIHHSFVERNLTAGGAADLLAATIFAEKMASPA